jgi:hypothetical protein
VGDVWQREVHTAEPLVILFRLKLLFESCKGMDEIPAKFIETLSSDIHKLVNSVCNKDRPQQGEKPVTVLIYKQRLNLQ